MPDNPAETAMGRAMRMAKTVPDRNRGKLEREPMPAKSPDTALADAILRRPELAQHRLRALAFDALELHANNRDAAKRYLIGAIKLSRDFDLAWSFFEFAADTAANRELDAAWSDKRKKTAEAKPPVRQSAPDSGNRQTSSLAKPGYIARPAIPPVKQAPPAAQPLDPQSRAARALAAKAETVKLSILYKFDIRGVLLGDVPVIDARGWLRTETLTLKRMTRDTRFVAKVLATLTDTGRIKDHYPPWREHEVDAMWEEVNREMAA